MNRSVKIAIVGYGKIARDQHVAAISATQDMELTAIVSRHGAREEGVPVFESLEELCASGLAIDAASHCNTPVARYHTARFTLQRGIATLLEKPPFASLSQCFEIEKLARDTGTILATSWHSQHNMAVDKAREWLAAKNIRQIRMNWIEDVHKWHPGQEWIWQPGGYGVFDPGMNGFSILTAVLPFPLHIVRSRLVRLNGKAMPVAASITLGAPHNDQIGTAALDWRGSEKEQWDIEIECEEGVLCLHDGGKCLTIDSDQIDAAPDQEYRGIYSAFRDAIRTGVNRVDFAPLILVADAFALAEWQTIRPIG